MGEASRRGTLEDRKAEAIKAGRSPEVSREHNRMLKQVKVGMKQAYLEYLLELNEEIFKAKGG